MQLNIAVGIPAVGRAPVLCGTLRELARQTRPPDRVIVCATKPADVEGAAAARPGVCVLLAEPGLTRQRNAVIDAAADADVAVFFDGDFVPHPHYLAMVERHMRDDPRIMVATGQVLADGMKGPGLTAAEAAEILAREGGRARRLRQAGLRLWVQHGGPAGADAPASPAVR